MKRLLLVLTATVLAFSASAATPKRKSAPKASAKKVAVAKAPAKSAAPVETAHRKTPYVGAISVDAATGRVLFEDHADAEAYPASVTKLMTLLLVMEDVKAGKYGYDDKVEATADAYHSIASWVGIKTGEKMTVRDLCMALMVDSANDAAMVLSVHAAGSWQKFVVRMNERAKALGMMHTSYFCSNGLPPNPVDDATKRVKPMPWKGVNVSTARDQMILARQLVRMPEVMSLTSIKTCDLVKTSDGYRVAVTRRTNEPTVETQPAEGEKIVKQMRNHNNVMRMDKLKIINPDGKEAVDGLKTGYIDAGGSSVVLTGARKGKRAIVVVLGSSSAKERDAQAQRLMNDALGSLAW